MASQILTREGYNRYLKELEDLKLRKRREVAEKIKEAREQGDLSENAEYDAARDEQRDIEARIEQIEAILADVTVVEGEESDTEVNIGSIVTVLDIEINEEREFKIVGSMEANSMKGKISNESPVGQAILKHKVGDIVKVHAPVGDLPYQILSIRTA